MLLLLPRIPSVGCQVFIDGTPDSLSAEPGALVKTCLGCKKFKSLDQFFPLKTGKDGLHPRCKACHRLEGRDRYKNGGKDKRDLVKLKDQTLMRKYGLTVQEFNAMLLGQNGVCAICKKPNLSIDHRSKKPRDLSVDHDHKTGKVRKLLCMNCNRGIGYLKDDPELLKRAAEYVEGHK